MIEFDQAIGVARRFVAEHPDTLLIVTGDHTHGNALIGTIDPARGEGRESVGVYHHAGFLGYKDENGDGYPDSLDVVSRIEHQRPVRRADHRRQQRHRPVLPERDLLKEAPQPAVGRRRLHRPAALGRDVREVDRAGADHADDEQAERFQPALAERNMRP